MKRYQKPVAIVNEDFSEGVYAASGSADCWTVSAKSVQDSNGSHNVFEVTCKHSSDVQHISSASTVTLTFNSPITDAYSESDFTTSVSGNTVTITRTLHANAYKAGDTVTYKVWVKAANEAMTKGLSVTGTSISCTKKVNVQGNGADGN